LARELVRRGHDVEVWTARIAGQEPREDRDGLRIHRVTSWRHSIHDCGLRGAASFAVFALHRLRALLRARPYDLIHCYFGLPCGPLGLYGLHAAGIPYVVSLRGSDVPGYDPTRTSLAALHWVLGPSYRRVLSAAAAVVPNSTSLGELMSRYHPGMPYQVIPNAAVDVPETRLDQRASHEPVRLLCVSRLVPRKGLDILLEAMATLNDASVVLDVVGTGQQADPLRRLTASLQLEDRVRFRGALRHEEVLQLCATADLFVLPALSESCSMAIIEAMTAALPVVTTRVGGNLDLVGDGINGLLVEPGSVTELAAAVRRLATDREERLAFGRAGQARIRRDYGAELHAERYEAVYARAAATARPRPVPQGR
jgi:glycosyltransferase involved in cell wall biosynthesis